MNAADSIVCRHYMYGFCKFGETCRKQHAKETCQEMFCENENCLKRHPRNCKFYDKYSRCKFGDYCAFAHRENPQLVENKIMKIKVEVLENDLNEERNDIIDLKEKVKGLEAIVEELCERLLTITTPTKEGTKKRRKVNQHPTPSPSYKHKESDADLGHHDEVDHGHDHQEDHNDGPNDDHQIEDEEEITAEEIMKMYENL
jgi:hypothetical protein